MSTKFDLNAWPREEGGKAASRRLRRQGRVPAIVYGARAEPEMISLARNELARNLEEEAFYSQVLDLKVGERSEQVVIKDLQRHPAKPFVLHVDLQRVSAAVKIRKVVPLHFLNEDSAKGVKEGGLASRNLTEVEVSCLPKDLPEYLDIDVAAMEIGDIIYLSQVPLPQGVTLSHAPDPDVPVVAIYGAQAQEEDTEEGGEEGAPSAAPES